MLALVAPMIDHAVSLADAAALVVGGNVVAFPTETVYGLGARADDDAAVAKIFATKGRPSDHPLIVHVRDIAAAHAFAGTLPPVAHRLMQAFWPGPLTVVVPRAPGVASAAAGGQNSIGLRCPAHPLAQALLQTCFEQGVAGIAAPSANRFGGVSPTRAEHVREEFGGAVPVLDGGPCPVGIESSIIDCTRAHPVLLRPGTLTRSQIESAASDWLRDADADAPRASGTLASHYAPRAKLRLMNGPTLQTAYAVLGELPPTLAVYSRTVSMPSGGALRRRMPDDAKAGAQELFAVWRELDTSGATLIWVETPPEDPQWDGVRDRLRRAAADLSEQ